MLELHNFAIVFPTSLRISVFWAVLCSQAAATCPCRYLGSSICAAISPFNHKPTLMASSSLNSGNKFKPMKWNEYWIFRFTSSKLNNDLGISADLDSVPNSVMLSDLQISPVLSKNQAASGWLSFSIKNLKKLLKLWGSVLAFIYFCRMIKMRHSCKSTNRLIL